jgi:hypothetical protein
MGRPNTYRPNTYIRENNCRRTSLSSGTLNPGNVIPGDELCTNFVPESKGLMQVLIQPASMGSEARCSPPEAG